MTRRPLNLLAALSLLLCAAAALFVVFVNEIEGLVTALWVRLHELGGGWACGAAIVVPAPLIVALCLRGPLRRLRRARRGLCRRCGYDLHASPAQCPECGAGVAESFERAARAL
jgi:hypothetical protein